jgi:hypothetical protein
MYRKILKAEQDEQDWGASMGLVAVLTLSGQVDKVTFEQRGKRALGVSHVAIWGRMF